MSYQDEGVTGETGRHCLQGRGDPRMSCAADQEEVMGTGLLGEDRVDRKPNVL